jgi:hypothetical protein
VLHTFFRCQCKTNANNALLRNIIPCSQVQVHRRFGGTLYLHLQDRRIKKQAVNRAVLDHEKETVRSSEIFVNFYHTTRLHFAEEHTRHRHSRDNNTELVLACFLQHKLYSAACFYSLRNVITRNNRRPHTVGNLTDTSISHSLSI